MPDRDAGLRSGLSSAGSHHRAIDVTCFVGCKEACKSRDVLRSEVGGDQTGVRAGTRRADGIHPFRRH